MRALSVLFSLAFLLSGCSRDSNSRTSASESGKTSVRKDFASHWQDESQYIVETIATDLAEMFRYSGQSSSDTPAKISVAAEELRDAPVLTYRVTVNFGADAISCELPMRTAIWAPATYIPLTTALARHSPLAAAATTDTALPSLVETLTTPTAITLAGADIELSQQLEARFTDPGLHHQAALLLGSFAMREASGLFYQIRNELCGMTAHLAFAKQLSPNDRSDIQNLAEALLTLLYNNQAEALTQLSTLPDANGFGSWKNALRLRATGDYRLGTGSSPSLLEIRETFRAKADSLSAERAWDDANFDKTNLLQPDWYWMLGEQSVPIRMGHLILQNGLSAQFQEIGAVFTRETGHTLSKDNLCEALNTPPSRFAADPADASAPRRVLGWGRMAAASQRHLAHLISENFDFMQNRWGVRDEAAEFRAKMDEMFGSLRLYPFVRRLNSTQQDYYRAAQDDARDLMMRSPEVVPAEVWNYTCYTVDGCQLYIPPPHAYVNEWHRHNPPPGTAYNPMPRMNQPSLTQQPDTIQRMEKLHQLAPYDTVIIHNLLRIRDGETQDPAKMAEAYHTVIDFNPMPNRRIARASASQPAEFEKWMSRAAALNPVDLHELARYYRDNGQEQKAAESYIAWIKVETDDVSVANDAEFLIEYFEKNQRAREATALADRAADAYSFNGLLAKANLLERRGRLIDALDMHHKLDERYGTPEELIGFLWRVQKTKPMPRFAKELESVMRATLPEGIAPYKNTQRAPARGIIVGEENELIRKAGLRQGDIVVAVRGYQVPDWKTFKVLRKLDPRQPFTMTAWRAGTYIELDPLPTTYRFGVDLADYQAP